MNLCQIKQEYYHCYIPSMECKEIKIIIVLLIDVLKSLPKIKGITDAWNYLIGEKSFYQDILLSI